MRKILLFILSVFLANVAFATKSPHGLGLKIDCAVCHTTDNWNKIKTGEFNHNKTNFPLVGQHKMVGCKKCHPTLEFSKAKTECSACHADIHEGTVGRDCNRCHNSSSWIVANVKKIHQQVGFPLIGLHATADCNRCHVSASSLRFNNLRSDCYSCHKYQYEATRKPNHKLVGLGTDCERCHNMVGREWTSVGKGFDHNGFFPLTGAHKTTDCTSCHYEFTENNYTTKVKTECSDCHSPGAARTTYPAHTTLYLKYSCGDCHTTLNWTTLGKFGQHDSWEGIYSGRHKGKWNTCTDCHSNNAAYKVNCNKCHDDDD